jgi:hypothetical protein
MKESARMDPIKQARIEQHEQKLKILSMLNTQENSYKKG